MRNIFLLVTTFILVACSGGDPLPGPGGGGNVSQYEARAWDGEKRAGVFYEIFVRSFADSNGDGIGDLGGVTARLDYLNELGVAGIWLTPIHPSPSYHGYDVTDYKAVNPDFGTMADFEAMVTKAHSLGIKVVLDFVVNHTSDRHPWFVSARSSTTSPYRGYYNFRSDGSYEGAFSPLMPDLNYGPAGTAETSDAFGAIVDAGRYWLAKGADGFRLDAVKHIYPDETSDENPTFLKKLYDELSKTKPDIYMIGEVLSEHDRVAPYYKGLPALFDFSSWWRLDYAINNHHAKWYPKDLLDYRAEYAAVRTGYIQATKLSNHDEDRTRTVLGDDVRRAKMAGAVLLTVSGWPYIYYGEEIGMLGSKSNGDEGVREPMLWARKAGDTFRTTWHDPKFSNDATVGSVEKQSADINSVYRLYKKFIELRNTYPALATGEMKLLPGFNDDEADKNFMVFTREAGSERLLVVHNVSNLAKTYSFPVDIARPIADFGGVSLMKSGSKYVSATMPPYTTIICEL
jgi:glycosidase